MFKNYEEYKAQRDALIAKAETAMNEGKTEDYNAAVKEVEDLDRQFDEFKERKAAVEAMKGAVKPPLSDVGVEGAVNVIVNQQDDQLEYRNQFMNYVMNGTPIKMSNQDEVTTSTDVGAVIPNTILNKIIEKLETVGGIYAKMTKTFYKGGVSIPTSTAKPVATWTSERGTSDKQKKTLGSITFSYHKLRCVVACSIAVDNVTLEIFEATLAKNIADAIVKAIESASFNGTGNTGNMPEGILTKDAPEGQTIEIEEGSDPTYDDFLAAEAALPDEYSNGTEWYMRKKTFFTKFLGLKDSNGQPIARVSMGIAGKPEYTILGRRVNFTEYVPAFPDTVSADTKFAVMFNFADYMLNTNLRIGMKEYEDHDTDDQIKKAVMLADGKPVDLNSMVVMMVKKK